MEVGFGIHRISLPLPEDAHGGVNSYLIEGDGGWALVDCGYDNPETLKVLENHLAEVGATLADVHTLILTHGHGDHYGLSGTIQRMVKPRVVMHRLDWERIHKRSLSVADSSSQHLGWLERNGLHTEGWSEAVKLQIARFRGFVGVVPDIFPEDGDTVQVGSRTLRVIWTPGHTQGHICLYDADHRALIAGDHLLGKTTPHTSILEPDEGDPVGSYMSSLAKVKELDVELVLAGHGEPFSGFGHRVAQLLGSQERRLAELAKLLPEGQFTGADMAERLPWSRGAASLYQLHPIRQRVALGQTLARLEVLRSRGLVTVDSDNGRIYYRRT